MGVITADEQNLKVLSSKNRKKSSWTWNKTLEMHLTLEHGFRRAHSTITALLRVSTGILMSSGAGEHSVLLLLDHMDDTVARHILLDGLRHWVGVTWFSLDWLESYLVLWLFLSTGLPPLLFPVVYWGTSCFCSLSSTF